MVVMVPTGACRFWTEGPRVNLAGVMGDGRVRNSMSLGEIRVRMK